MLRTRSLVVLALFSITLVAAAVLLAKTTFVSDFDQLERNQARIALATIRNSLLSEMTKFDEFLVDWSAWDDTYRFIADVNEAYQRSNLVKETFSYSRISDMVFLDAAGNLRYGKAYDPAKGLLSPVDPSLVALIKSVPQLWHFSSPKAATKGLLVHSKTIYLVVARPIVTSDFKGPIRGTLLLLRTLTPDQVHLLEKTVQHRLSWTIDILKRQKASTVQSWRTRLDANGLNLVGHIEIPELSGKYLVTIETAIPRTILRKAYESLLFFAVTILVVCLSGAGLLWTLEDRSIFRRLGQLITRLCSDVSSQSTFYGKEEKSRDEITVLSHTLDDLLTRLEEAIAEGKRREREILSVLENSPAGIFLIDKERRVVTWANTKALELIDRPFVETVEHSCREFLCPNPTGPCPVIDEGRLLRDQESILSAKDGTSIPVLRSSVTLTVHGTPHLLETVMDLRPLKTVEAELDRARKMETVGLVAGGVAHDLNNLLTSLIGYPDLLLSQIDETSPFYRPLLSIRDSARKAGAIVQDLLALARRGIKKTSPISVTEEVTAYLASPEFVDLRRRYPSIRFESFISPGEFYVMGSQAHFHKVLSNLIHNAAEAIDDTGVVQLKVERRKLDSEFLGYERIPPGNYMVVTVHDTGQGIPPQHIPHIFEPFYSKKKMRSSGTGLGMTIVWHTVKDMGGYVDVHSREGISTTISLYLPMCDPPVEHALQGESSVPQGGGQRILVVDDMEDQRTLAEAALTALGYKVRVAANGEEALCHCSQDPPDLLVLDMELESEMDGPELYRRITQRHPHVKAIVVSGYAEPDRIREVMDLGASLFLPKPYSLRELARAVKEALAEP